MLAESSKSEMEVVEMSASAAQAAPQLSSTELVPPRPRLRSVLAAFARWQRRERMHGATMPRLRWY